MARSIASMDYAEHEKTFTNFVHLVRFAMESLALVVLALYSFIIAHNPWLGLFFLILSLPAGFLASGFGRKRR